MLLTKIDLVFTPPVIRRHIIVHALYIAVWTTPSSGPNLKPILPELEHMAFSPGLGHIPLAWAIFTLFSIIFCYFYAVSVGHLYPFVPSISNTGATAPEGDIFSEAMNISSTVCLLIMTIRYFQLKHRAARFYALLERFNMMSLTAGLVSVLGVTLIANFPSAKVRVMPFHLTMHALQESSIVCRVCR